MNALASLLTALAAILTAMATPKAGPRTGRAPTAPVPRTDRERVLAVAEREIGTQEKTGHNDGDVVKYLEAVGLEAGEPYCAAFIFWCGREALGTGNPFPRSGWSPDFVARPDWLRGKGTAPAAGDTFGIWFADKNRIAHTGFVAGTRGQSIVTIEANTSAQQELRPTEADRNGDGVWRKIRPLATIHSTKRWLP